MPQERVRRRLAAILAADVVGYSRLMGEDEAGTLAALNAHRETLIDPAITEHQGRIVKLMGDGTLVEFPSVVEAVRCAIKIQRGIGKRNADVPASRRIAFRIGINLGDVIVEGDDIYGNGVNVAARLETLAEPGGICISGRVLEQVEKNVDVGFVFLGPQSVKNIEKPINAYQALLDPADARKMPVAFKPYTTRQRRWASAVATLTLIVFLGGAAVWQWMSNPEVDTASVERMALPLPDRPSIAVLPFENLSGDPEQDYFAAGVTENIITELSRFRGLFVIARNSVLTYADRPVRVQQVAEDLGVRYVLEGSVQRSSDRLRITVQLIDAIQGDHLWAERYDREALDILDVQDDVTEKIVASLGAYEGELAEAVVTRAERKGLENLSAYEAFLLGIQHKHRFTKEDNALAVELFAKAIQLDPEFTRAHVGLAWAYGHQYWFAWSDTPHQSLERALEAARTALALDDSEAEAHWVLADLLIAKRNPEQAIARYERALALNPNHADLLADWGWNLAFLGRAPEGVMAIRKAMRLNPRHPDWYERALGEAAYAARQYDEAIDALKLVESHVHTSRLTLAASYAQLGLIEEARAQMAEATKLDLDTKLEQIGYLTTYPHVNSADQEHWLEGLRKAGLPE